MYLFKNKHKLLVILSILSLSFVLSSCNKSKDNNEFNKCYKYDGKDEESRDCKTKVLYENNQGSEEWDNRQFLVLDGKYEGKTFIAVNFSEFESNIESGYNYKIGYKIVPADLPTDNIYIEITCITKTEKKQSCNCNKQPISADSNFNLHLSNAIGGAFIKDDKLYVKGQYIGTSMQYFPSYELHIYDDTTANKLLAVAKLDKLNLELDGGLFLDLRTYNKDFCFDLSAIKKRYLERWNLENLTLAIELKLVNGESEILYYQLN